MWKNRYVSTTIVSLFIALMTLAALAPAAQAQRSETKIVASDGVDGDFFGQAVAISGSTAVVGVRDADLGNDENAGAAYVFERIDGQWQEVQKLIASNGDEGDFFGDRITIDGDMILVGAPGNDDRAPENGAVYAFERIDGVWQEVQIFYPDDTSASKVFGWDVALDGDRAFIGAPQDSQVDFFAGATYVFERQNDEWVQDDKLLPPLGVGGDVLASFFGLDIGLDGDRVIISASTEDDAAPFAGTASVFERINGQWQLFDKLLPPPVDEPDSLDEELFGSDVTLTTGRSSARPVTTRAVHQ